MTKKVIMKSGWCLDRHHDRCDKYYFGKWQEHDCNCECHGKGENNADQ